MRKVMCGGIVLFLLFANTSLAQECPTEKTEMMGSSAYTLEDVYETAKPHLGMSYALFKKCIAQYNEDVSAFGHGIITTVPRAVGKVLDSHGYLKKRALSVSVQIAPNAKKVPETPKQGPTQTLSEAIPPPEKPSEEIPEDSYIPSTAEELWPPADSLFDTERAATLPPAVSTGTEEESSDDVSNSSPIAWGTIIKYILILLLAGAIIYKLKKAQVGTWIRSTLVPGVYSFIEELKKKRESKPKPPITDNNVNGNGSKRPDNSAFWANLKNDQSGGVPESLKDKDQGFSDDIPEEKRRKLRDDGIMSIKPKPRQPANSDNKT